MGWKWNNRTNTPLVVQKSQWHQTTVFRVQDGMILRTSRWSLVQPRERTITNKSMMMIGWVRSYMNSLRAQQKPREWRGLTNHHRSSLISIAGDGGSICSFYKRKQVNDQMIIIRIIIPLITREPLQFRTQETFVMVHDSCRDETLGVQPLLPNHNNSAKISIFLIIKSVAVHLPSDGGCKIGRQDFIHRRTCICLSMSPLLMLSYKWVWHNLIQAAYITCVT